MDQWMNDFPYHTAMRPWTFALAIVSTFLVAWITVSFHSIKASVINPAETLKNE
jgi:putative ABC transport system permease protein